MPKSREIKNTNEIVSYFHCGECVKELKASPPPWHPAEYQKIQVGFTKLGIQVWCRRHDCNIAHIDFEGEKHPANTTAAPRIEAPTVEPDNIQ